MMLYRERDRAMIACFVVCVSVRWRGREREREVARKSSNTGSRILAREAPVVSLMSVAAGFAPPSRLPSEL